MLNRKTSRREMLKTSAQVAGLAAATPAISWALSQQGEAANPATAQRQFIESVLKKHAARSKTTTSEEIAEFAVRFTEVNGVVDYKKMFGTLSGEYRLTRLFVRSVRHGVKV